VSSQAIVAAVRDALTQSTSVTNLVSTRIFTAFRDTTTLPAIVLTTGQDANVSPTFGRTDCLRKFTVDPLLELHHSWRERLLEPSRKPSND
jgi:hypothetical protein